jgi:hypothetical protein
MAFDVRTPWERNPSRNGGVDVVIATGGWNDKGEAVNCVAERFELVC